VTAIYGEGLKRIRLIVLSLAAAVLSGCIGNVDQKSTQPIPAALVSKMKDSGM
jgi:hypothetical protein